MKEFQIQPIGLADLVYVSSIMQKRWDVSAEWADREARRFLIADADTAGFCVHHEDTIIGVGLFDRHNDDVSVKYGPWLYLLWVEPEYRGHNLGIELTKKRMEHARNHGYTEIYLDTTETAPYHRVLGWEDVTVVQYEGEPDLIMKYDLSKEFPVKEIKGK